MPVDQEMAGVLARLPAQAPTFAFLDPDGMELIWSTIREIADHKREYAVATGRSKVEMWILFSTSGIGRVLGSNRAHAVKAGLLDKVAALYGARGPWQAVWDARLSGQVTPGEARHAYLFLHMDRLQSLGYRHLLVRRPAHGLAGGLPRRSPRMGGVGGRHGGWLSPRSSGPTQRGTPPRVAIAHRQGATTATR